MSPDFTALFKAHFAEVRRWVTYLGGAPADADDLSQRVFEVVLARLPDFDGRNVRGWLYAISRRVVASYRRRAWVRGLFLPRPEAPQLFDSSTEDAELSFVRRRQAEAILARLPEKLRTTFILHEVEGLSVTEIADLMAVPQSTIYSRLRLARERFVQMSHEEEEGSQ